jgi:hypothetical protein
MNYLAAESFEVAFGRHVESAALDAVAKFAPAVLEPQGLHGRKVRNRNELHLREIHVLAPTRLLWCLEYEYDIIHGHGMNYNFDATRRAIDHRAFKYTRYSLSPTCLSQDHQPTSQPLTSLSLRRKNNIRLNLHTKARNRYRPPHTVVYTESWSPSCTYSRACDEDEHVTSQLVSLLEISRVKCVG